MCRKIKVILTILVFSICVDGFAKRLGPEKVEPVVHGKVVYHAPHFTLLEGAEQKGGYIEARDARSGAKIWQLLVYKTEYDSGLEQDVQDVFIIALSINSMGTILTVTDERGRQYKVDLKSRSLMNTAKR